MMSTVIVTVRFEKANFEQDMEVPADIPCTELCKSLLLALEEMDAETFSSFERIKLRLKRNGKVVDDDETLQSKEIWDGSILLIEEGAA